MNIATIIYTLKEIQENKPNVKLYFLDEFGQMFTSNFEVDSWRGSYDKPAIVVYPISDKDEGIPISRAISNLSLANGYQVTGWKGGEFILSDQDELYLVAEWGTAGNSVVIAERTS